MDNQRPPYMFYQSKYQVVKTVLELEMWIWDMDAPMNDIGGKKRKRERKKQNFRKCLNLGGGDRGAGKKKQTFLRG